MKPVYYRPAKLALAAVGLGASAVMLLGVGETLWSTAVGSFSAIGALAAGACAVDQRPALSLTGRSLAIRTMFRRKVVDIASVLVISVESRAVRLAGVIPIARKEFLVIRVQGGLIGSEKFSLAAGMLALPPGGLAEVCQWLREERGSATGQSADAASGHFADGAESSGFDPDAVIARYLARKAEAADPEPQPQKSTLSPRLASRPAFGRRGA